MFILVSTAMLSGMISGYLHKSGTKKELKQNLGVIMALISLTR